MRVACLLVLLPILATARLAGAEPEAAVAEAIPIVDDPAAWKCVPHSLNISRDLNWRDDKIDENSYLRLTCEVTAPAGTAVFMAGALEITELETDAGSMPATPHESASHNGGQHLALWRLQQAAGRRDLQAHVTLASLPPAEATRFSRLRGHVDIEIVTGEQEDLRLHPAKDQVDRPVAVPGHDQGPLIMDLDPLTIRIPSDLDYLGQGLKLYQADGTEIHRRGWSRIDDGDGAKIYEFRLSLPPDGTLVFPLSPPTITRRLPFELTDLPLPGHVPEGLRWDQKQWQAEQQQKAQRRYAERKAQQAAEENKPDDVTDF